MSDEDGLKRFDDTAHTAESIYQGVRGALLRITVLVVTAGLFLTSVSPDPPDIYATPDVPWLAPVYLLVLLVVALLNVGRPYVDYGRRFSFEIDGENSYDNVDANAIVMAVAAVVLWRGIPLIYENLIEDAGLSSMWNRLFTEPFDVLLSIFIWLLIVFAFLFALAFVAGIADFVLRKIFTFFRACIDMASLQAKGALIEGDSGLYQVLYKNASARLSTIESDYARLQAQHEQAKAKLQELGAATAPKGADTIAGEIKREKEVMAEGLALIRAETRLREADRAPRIQGDVSRALARIERSLDPARKPMVTCTPSRDDGLATRALRLNDRIDQFNKEIDRISAMAKPALAKWYTESLGTELRTAIRKFCADGLKRHHPDQAGQNQIGQSDNEALTQLFRDVRASLK